ncbi:hypothetical protein E2C01_074862 [Portunus trituberculatus]|uniref:Uncharacterized protein n=1 Tax=Portunus trituberculatus TaxID=210409 RepID=A0A5B7IE92_PORTR|nr:hypothetical protein [Portunus trituberculatus]
MASRPCPEGVVNIAHVSRATVPVLVCFWHRLKVVKAAEQKIDAECGVTKGVRCVRLCGRG